MERTLGTIGAAGAIALAWAVVWALPGGAIEALDNIAPAAHGFTRQIDMWPQTLGLPGLVGGVIFSVLLLITEGKRGVAELSLFGSGGWGAASGLLVGALVVWGVDSGLSQPWPLAAAALAYAALMGAASGIASTLLFRYAEQGRLSALS